MDKQEKTLYFDRIADGDRWLRKRRYYRQQVQKLARFIVPEGKSVLEVGSGSGDALAALKPSRGVGVDFSRKMVALAGQRHPGLTFHVDDIERLKRRERFDYVLMLDLLGQLSDIHAAFTGLRVVTTPESRVLITYYNHLWEPVLKLAESLHLKARQFEQNWLSSQDVENILSLADFEIVQKGEQVLIPVDIPLLSWAVNKYVAPLPGIRRLCLLKYVVAKRTIRQKKDYSVSIIIPCRNEAGNIEAAIDRMPAFGKRQQMIFVDGNSTDGTLEKIKAVIRKHRNKDISLILQGDGRGKGDAVRKGFDAASGDVLMILDADLTVPPEDLPKFYDAIADGKGEFINGTRLVYPMEKQAMRTINLFGNKMFSVIFTWLLNQRIKDTLCGTKVLFRKDYQKIKENRAFFGDFDPFGDFDLLFGAAKQNLKIIDMPVRYRSRTYGETKISRFRHGMILLRMCVFAAGKLKFR